MDATLRDEANKFFENTKKMFKSCTFAAMNINGPRQDWEVWGDFKNKNKAIEAAKAWGYAFKHAPKIEIVSNKYRVSVSM